MHWQHIAGLCRMLRLSRVIPLALQLLVRALAEISPSPRQLRHEMQTSLSPRAIIAVYPIAQPDTMTTSYVENANAKPLNRPMMGWFAKHATRTPSDMQDPRINLVKANLAGLPPVTIINAQIDPLRDDGAMLEQALKTANIEVERRVYDGVAHEFFGMAAVVDKAKDAQEYASNRLKSALKPK